MVVMSNKELGDSMSMNFNKITFGNEYGTDTVEQNDLKAGLRKEGLSAEFQSIFDAFDDGNGILEQHEIDALKAEIQNAAAQDGDATTLTEQEAAGFLQKLGIKGIDSRMLFQFLSISKAQSVYIESTVRNDNDEIVINYKPNQDGESFSDSYNASNGRLNAYTVSGSDGVNFTRTYSDDGTSKGVFSYGEEVYYDSEGEVVGGKVANSLKTYTRTNNPDGSYTITFSDDRVENYDADGRWTGGITNTGEEYTNEYDEEGNRTWKCGNRSAYISKDGDLLREVDENGNSYSVATLKNNDGTKVELYNDGREYTYDELGRCIGGKRTDGTTFTYEYDSDGNYTYKDSTGEETTFNYNAKLTGGKVAGTNTTFTRTYSADDKYGSYRYDEYTQEDGSKIYKGANGKIAHRSVAGALTIRSFAKHGESFDMVMNKLGIKTAADKAAFRQANPAAAEKGKFEVGQLDVVIPKSIADHIDLDGILGNKDELNDREKPQLGI